MMYSITISILVIGDGTRYISQSLQWLVRFISQTLYASVLGLGLKLVGTRISSNPCY